MNGTTEPKFRWKRSHGGFGRVKLMAKGDGYVMVRYPRCMPFIMTEKDWLALPATEPVGVSANEQRNDGLHLGARRPGI